MPFLPCFSAEHNTKEVKPLNSISSPERSGFGVWLKSYTGQKYLITVLFLLIPLTALILFTFIPAFNMFVWSFQRRGKLTTEPTWVGFQNYVTLFTDPSYLSTFRNSGFYLVGSVIQTFLSQFMALILVSKLRLKSLFKGIIFFPYIMNGVAVALIFQCFFKNGDGAVIAQGTLNSILEAFGKEPVSWLSTPGLANWCLVAASIWKYIGFDILYYSGAIMSINPDIYEAADLDGANAWQRYRYIIFPAIKPVIGLQLLLSIRGAISVYEMPFVITGGQFGTSTFVIKTMDVAFAFDKFGMGSAMAMTLLVITIILSLIQKAAFKENT